MVELIRWASSDEPGPCHSGFGMLRVMTWSDWAPFLSPLALSDEVLLLPADAGRDCGGTRGAIAVAHRVHSAERERTHGGDADNADNGAWPGQEAFGSRETKAAAVNNGASSQSDKGRAGIMARRRRSQSTSQGRRQSGMGVEGVVAVMATAEKSGDDVRRVVAGLEDSIVCVGQLTTAGSNSSRRRSGGGRGGGKYCQTAFQPAEVTTLYGMFLQLLI